MLSDALPDDLLDRPLCACHVAPSPAYACRSCVGNLRMCRRIAGVTVEPSQALPGKGAVTDMMASSSPQRAVAELTAKALAYIITLRRPLMSRS